MFGRAVDGFTQQVLVPQVCAMVHADVDGSVALLADKNVSLNLSSGRITGQQKTKSWRTISTKWAACSRTTRVCPFLPVATLTSSPPCAARRVSVATLPATPYPAWLQ